MDNKELIALFVKRSEDRSNVYEDGNKKRRVIQEEFNALLKEEYRKIHPRGNFTHKAKQRAEIANYDALLKPFMARADAVGVEERKQYRLIGIELTSLANQIKITDDMKIDVVNRSQWTVYGGASTSDYRTQGFGAPKYARDHAERDLDHVQACDVNAVLVIVEADPTYSCGYSMPTIDFKVYAGCSAEVCEIIRKKDGLSLREVVKRSWRKGVNPRVAMPMLDPGFEAREGLDYFGNDTKGKAQ